jgi:hypothetical protein
VAAPGLGRKASSGRSEDYKDACKPGEPSHEFGFGRCVPDPQVQGAAFAVEGSQRRQRLPVVSVLTVVVVLDDERAEAGRAGEQLQAPPIAGKSLDELHPGIAGDRGDRLLIRTESRLYSIREH